MLTEDHQTADVLALCSSADVPSVERWVLWLRTIGITVQLATPESAGEAVNTASVVAFVTPASDQAVMKCPALGAMLLERKPAVIVQLDKPESAPPPHVFSVVPAYRISETAARDNIQRVLDRYEIRGFRNDFIWHGANERRRAARLSRKWQWAMVASVLLAPVLAWKILPLVRSLRRTHAQIAAPTTTESTPAAANTRPTAPIQAPPPPPTTRSDFAKLHVRNLFAAWSREHGFAPGQIDRVVAFFADPTFIEGKGTQTGTGVRASLLVLEQQWPYFQETAQSMTTEIQPDGAIAVTVVSQHQSRNEQRGTSDAGAWRSRYTIVFDAQDKPLISRIDFPSEKL
jgi:hypothetical protein